VNLLAETLADIARTRHTPDDVIYIGSRDGYTCTWEEFTHLADREYDNGYGGQEVAADLEIHFRDGGWLERHEYDGSEDWTYRAPFTIPTTTKPIVRLIQDDEHYDAYAGLAALHADDA
jgi:hypothetical protein